MKLRFPYAYITHGVMSKTMLSKSAFGFQKGQKSPQVTVDMTGLQPHTFYYILLILRGIKGYFSDSL